VGVPESRALRSRLLAVADAVLGPVDAASDGRGRWLVRYLCVAAVLAVIVAARRLDAVTNPQFWGEDGFLYFKDDLIFGFPGAAERLYMGFPHLGQRLVGFAGGLVPFAAAPRVYATLTIAITALGLASFALPGFRHLVRSDALRVLWCIAAASLPVELGVPPVQFGGVLSNPANLGWWVGIWLALLSLMRLPGRAGRVALLAFGGALAVFTTPLAPVCAPFWRLRAWRGARRRSRSELAFALTLLVALALCILITRNLGANPGGSVHLSFFDNPPGYLERYGALVADRIAALALAPGPLATVRAAGSGAVAAIAIAACAALLASSLPARSTTLPALLAALYLFLASLLLTTLGRLVWAVLPLNSFPARYTLLPGAALVLAIVIALDGLPRGVLRGAAIVGVTALLVWSWRPRFVTEPFADQHWPRYAALLDQKVRSGSTAPLTIPINPPWTPIKFDVRPLAPNPPVPPSLVLAGLGPDETFRQTFLSECDGLDGITLRFAEEKSPTAGAIELALVEDERNEVLASVTIPRDQLLQRTPQPLYVPPIAASAGRRYTIVARAVGIDPAVPVRVLGAANDQYRDGYASFAGAAPDLDASFAYSCASTRGAVSR